MDLGAVREALAAACRTVVDASGRLLTAYAYAPDAADPPCAYPLPETGNYGADLDGDMDVVVTLRVLTSRAEDRAGQEHLDALLAKDGATSLRAALEADQTLGGLVSAVTAVGWDGYRTYEVAGTEMFGADLAVEVME